MKAPIKAILENYIKQISRKRRSIFATQQSALVQNFGKSPSFRNLRLTNGKRIIGNWNETQFWHCPSEKHFRGGKHFETQSLKEYNYYNRKTQFIYITE